MLTRSVPMLENHSQESCMDIAMMMEHVNTARLSLKLRQTKNIKIHHQIILPFCELLKKFD
jgi:hypothetical protein